MDDDDPLSKFLPIIKDGGIQEGKLYIISTMHLHDISLIEEPVNPYCYIEIHGETIEQFSNNLELWEEANKKWLKDYEEALLAVRRDQEEAEKPFRKRVKSSYEALRRLLWKRPCR